MDLITPGLGIIFWQTITFLVVLVILRKFAWKKIITSIEERENSIRGALNSAKEAKRQIDKLQEKGKEIIDEANLEGERILKEAISSKEFIINEAKKEALKTSEEILAKAKKIIEKEKDLAIFEVRKNISDLVISLTEKLLLQKMENPEEHKKLIEQMVNDISEAS